MRFDKLKIRLRNGKFPKEIRLDKGSVITDVPKFIESHIKTLEANSGNKTFKPYYYRLIKILKYDTTRK